MSMALTGRCLSIQAVREALASRSMFSVVDVETGWKVDLIIRKDRPFSVVEFARRAPVVFCGVTVPVTSVEDLVLAKLEWARLGASARQLDDVRPWVRVALWCLESRIPRSVMWLMRQ